VSLVETRQPPRLRSAAWLLILSLLLFVMWLVGVVSTMSGTGVTDAADLTPAQMQTVGTGWLLQWPFYTAAILAGAVGMTQLNTALRDTPAGRIARVSTVVSALSAVVAVAHLVLIELSAGFTEARLGDNPAYATSQVLSYTTIWAAGLVIVLTGLALRTGGMLRRTGSVIAVLAALFLVADVLTRGFPPFVVGFFWLAIGVCLLRRRVPSSA
jgi:hypothetical protein